MNDPYIWFIGFCEWVCHNGKRCCKWKSSGCCGWSCISYWPGKEQVYFFYFFNVIYVLWSFVLLFTLTIYSFSFVTFFFLMQWCCRHGFLCATFLKYKRQEVIFYHLSHFCVARTNTSKVLCAIICKFLDDIYNVQMCVISDGSPMQLCSTLIRSMEHPVIGCKSFLLSLVEQHLLTQHSIQLHLINLLHLQLVGKILQIRKIT